MELVINRVFLLSFWLKALIFDFHENKSTVLFFGFLIAANVSPSG